MSQDSKHVDVIVVGGGQAGLSMSYFLKQAGIDHRVLNKGQVADSWRHQRWDSFCLVTPNWQCQLPGFYYQGDDPDGFMVKDEIIRYLEDYVTWFEPPLKHGVTVTRIQQHNNVFCLETSEGPYTANQVVMACGSYHSPRIPATASKLPQRVVQLHAAEYKNARQLPEGNVLVVGTGQSGCQIAEDLHLEGRQVYLAVGSAPRVARRYRGKEVINWLEEMGYYETTIDQHPDGLAARKKTNHYVTGRDGGRDINLRVFAKQGMQLFGRLAGIDGEHVQFEDNLKQNLDHADAAAERINQDIEAYIVKNHLDAPPDDSIRSDYLPPTRLSINLAEENITTIIWSTGFNMDFSWVDLPVFDGTGYPAHLRGVTSVPGFYFLGLNWLNTWGSGRFYHVGRDAQFLYETMQMRAAAGHDTRSQVSG